MSKFWSMFHHLSMTVTLFVSAYQYLAGDTLKAVYLLLFTIFLMIAKALKL